MEHVNTALYGAAAVVSVGWVTMFDKEPTCAKCQNNGVAFLLWIKFYDCDCYVV